MFKKINIIAKINPITTTEMYVNNAGINNVSFSIDSGQNIVTFNSAGEQFYFNGTIAQFKTTLGL